MVTMVVRLDAYSVIYGIFLGVFILLPRKKCYYVWPFYVGFLALLILTQYLSCLGVPPGLCYGESVCYTDAVPRLSGSTTRSMLW